MEENSEKKHRVYKVASTSDLEFWTSPEGGWFLEKVIEEQYIHFVPETVCALAPPPTPMPGQYYPQQDWKTFNRQVGVPMVAIKFLLYKNEGVYSGEKRLVYLQGEIITAEKKLEALQTSFGLAGGTK